MTHIIHRQGRYITVPEAWTDWTLNGRAFRRAPDRSIWAETWDGKMVEQRIVSDIEIIKPEAA